MIANELRLGNWVKYCGVGYMPVGIVDLTLIANGETREDIYDAIPLTPEILGKCGFEWDIFYQGFSNGRYVVKILHDSNISVSYCKRRHDELQFMPYIKYLHQLQNFIFALTGEELNINL